MIAPVVHESRPPPSTDFTFERRRSLHRPESARGPPATSLDPPPLAGPRISRRRMLHERLLLPLSKHSLPASSSSSDAPILTASAEQGSGHEAVPARPSTPRLPSSCDAGGSDRATVDAVPRTSMPPSRSWKTRDRLPLEPPGRDCPPGDRREGRHLWCPAPEPRVAPRYGPPLRRADPVKSRHCNEEPDTFERQSRWRNREKTPKLRLRWETLSPANRRLVL